MRAFNFSAHTEKEYSDIFLSMVSALKAGSKMTSDHNEASYWPMDLYMLCGEALCTNPKNQTSSLASLTPSADTQMKTLNRSLVQRRYSCSCAGRKGDQPE
jgi:hypothetical protein